MRSMASRGFTLAVIPLVCAGMSPPVCVLGSSSYVSSRTLQGRIRRLAPRPRLADYRKETSERHGDQRQRRGHDEDAPVAAWSSCGDLAPTIADPPGDLGAAVAWSRISAAWRYSPAGFLQYKGTDIAGVLTAPWNAVVDVAWENENGNDVNRIDYGPFSDRPTPLFIQLFNATNSYQLFLLGAAVVGLLFAWKSPRLLLAASLPICAVAAHFFTLFIPRYFMPAMVGIIVLAAAALVGIYLTIRRLVASLREGSSPVKKAPTPKTVARGRRA
jgi:hypothetical protein